MLSAEVIVRLLAAILSLLCSASALAQTAADAPTASLLQTVRSSGVDAGTSGALDRMIRQRLDELGPVHVSGQVALDLEQLQIALGCIGENDACLRAVATETGTRFVLVPSLDRAESELVASVLLFDVSNGLQRRASRRASGATAMATLLEEVEPMLRELFQMPAAQGRDGRRDAAPGGAARPAEPMATRASLSPWPIVILSVGVVAAIGGVVVAGLAAQDRADYRSTAISTSADVDRALSILDRANTEATAANALMIGGGVIAAAGLTWLLAAGNEDASSPLALSPVVGPAYVGLAFRSTGGGP
jgi:hypothetical protein